MILPRTNKLNKIVITFSIITILLVYPIFLTVEVFAKEHKENKEKEKTVEKKNNKESGEIIKNYFENSSVLSGIMEDESILEIVRIPKDKPLTEINAQYMYCWYLDQGDQISGIEALNLMGRVQAEFNDEQVEKFKTLDCPTILK